MRPLHSQLDIGLAERFRGNGDSWIRAKSDVWADSFLDQNTSARARFDPLPTLSFPSRVLVMVGRYDSGGASATRCPNA